MRRIPDLEQAGAIAMQNISVDTVCYIIIKAREYDVKTAPVIRDPASNPSDDGEVEVLQDDPGDPTQAELSAALRRLNRDEMIELLAMMWLGRGDFTIKEWEDAVAQARDEVDEHTPGYLMGTPLQIGRASCRERVCP